MHLTVAYHSPTLLFIHENDQESVPLLPFQTETSVFKTTIVARTPTVQIPRDLTTALAILDSAGMDINAKVISCRTLCFSIDTIPWVVFLRKNAPKRCITFRMQTHVLSKSYGFDRKSLSQPALRVRLGVPFLLRAPCGFFSLESQFSAHFQCYSLSAWLIWTTDFISDIDECSQNSPNCSYKTATCNNSEGSFKCICKPGFSGDGHNCTGAVQ